MALQQGRPRAFAVMLDWCVPCPPPCGRPGVTTRRVRLVDIPDMTNITGESARGFVLLMSRQTLTPFVGFQRTTAIWVKAQRRRCLLTDSRLRQC